MLLWITAGRKSTSAGISPAAVRIFPSSKCGCPLDVTRFTPSERTKFGVPLPRLHDYSQTLWTPSTRACALQSDYLDVVQFHFSPAREVLEHAGLSRRCTTSSVPARCASWAFFHLPNLTDHITMGVFDVFQIPYSALQPEHEAAIARRPGVERASSSAAAWPAVSRVQGRAPPTSGSSGARQDGRVAGGYVGYGVPAALHHDQPGLHTTIVGTLNPAHLHANIAAVLRGRYRPVYTLRPSAALLRRKLMNHTTYAYLVNWEGSLRSGGGTSPLSYEPKCGASVVVGGNGSAAKSADEIGRLGALMMQHQEWVYDLEAYTFRACFMAP